MPGKGRKKKLLPGAGKSSPIPLRKLILRSLMGLLAIFAVAFLVAPIVAAQEAGAPPAAASALTAPVTPGPPAPPAIEAASAMLINADDGNILFSLNPDARLPMASTTKMMTALIIVEEHMDHMDEQVLCSQRAAEVGESSIWLTTGEKLSVQQMLMGTLIQSGNDAAMALAEYDAGSVESFVEKMNRRAAELGLTNTHFMNPHGLDEEGHYTSAADFARLGREVMKHSEIREIVKLTAAEVPWPGQPYQRQLINHNHLLDLDPAVNGIKTGYTDAAGQCIIISAGQDGTNLILAYLGGASIDRRNEDVINLLGFGFNSYRQERVVTAGSEYSSIDLPLYNDRQLALVADSDLEKKVYAGGEVDRRVVIPDEIRLPIHRGEKIGLVEAFEGSRYLGSTYLVATEDVPVPGFTTRITYYIKAVYNLLLFAFRMI
jgi:D-alanyl-D-alanine carboxypeptidase (penicillin-binding protein 5/6)